METLSDVIIHLRDKVAPLVSGETQELIFDAIYALKAISTKQHLDKRSQRQPTEADLEEKQKLADEAWAALWPGLDVEG